MKTFKIIIAFCFSRNAADQSTPPTPQCSSCPPQSPGPDCRPHRYRELIECALGPLVLVHPRAVSTRSQVHRAACPCPAIGLPRSRLPEHSPNRPSCSSLQPLHLAPSESLFRVPLLSQAYSLCFSCLSPQHQHS